jgi:hypothetical protein
MVFPGTILSISTTVRRRSWVVTGVIGVVGFFGGQVGSVVLGATGVSLMVAFPGLVVWMGIALVGATHGTVVLGAVLGDRVDLGSRWHVLALGASTLAAANLVPVLGNVLNLAVGALGMEVILGRLYAQVR